MSESRILATVPYGPSSDGFGRPSKDSSYTSLWSGRYARISTAASSGPTGPTGPSQGPTGPTGPAGPLSMLTGSFLLSFLGGAGEALASPQTFTVHYTLIGNIVFLSFPLLSALSNNTSGNAPLRSANGAVPPLLTPAVQKIATMPYINTWDSSSNLYSSTGRIFIDAAGAIYIYPDDNIPNNVSGYYLNGRLIGYGHGVTNPERDNRCEVSYTLN